MSYRIAIWVLSIVLLSSCASKKKAKTTTKAAETETKVTINSVELNNINYHTFAGKAKANVKLKDESQRVSLTLRVENQRRIWISVTATLGIEVARVLITPQRIQIMNRLHGEYYDKPFEYIYNYSSKVLTFATLQDILVGNVSTELLQTASVDVAKSKEDVQVIGVNEDLVFHYLLNMENKPEFLKISQSETEESLEANYQDYTDFSGYHFARINKLIFTSEESPVQAELEYSEVSFNEVLDFPFSVPSRYKVFY